MASNGSEGRPISPVRPMTTLDETPTSTMVNWTILGDRMFYSNHWKRSTTTALSRRNDSGKVVPVYTISDATILYTTTTVGTTGLTNNVSIEPRFQFLTIICNTVVLPDDRWTEFNNLVTATGTNHD